MSDVILHDGREIEIDLYQCSLKEFRNLLDPGKPDDEGDEILAKVCGLTKAEIQSLPYPDYRALVKAFYAKARNPLADPNLESAST